MNGTENGEGPIGLTMLGMVPEGGASPLTDGRPWTCEP